MENLLPYIIIFLVVFLPLSTLVKAIINQQRVSTGILLKDVQPLQMNAMDILDDYRNLLIYECEKAFNQDFTYEAAKKALGFEHSPYNNRMIITDEMLDTVTLQISEEILTNMASPFRERLYQIIDPKYLDDFTLKEVYYILFTKALEVNKRALS